MVWSIWSDEECVEAIEGGKIVRVEASYARREGLPILRPILPDIKKETAKENSKKEEGSFFQASDLKAMLSHKQKNPLEKALVPNFHWQVVRARRERNITRKQLAKQVGFSLKEVQMLENGIFPTQNLVALAKLEEVLGISIRKGAEEIEQPMRRMIERKIVRIDDKDNSGKNKKIVSFWKKNERDGEKYDFDKDVLDDAWEEDTIVGEEIELDDNSKDL